MNFQAFKEAVIAQAQSMGITEYELYYQASESTSVGAFQHEIKQFTSSIDGGVCFRCIVNGKMGYASTEDLSPEQAKAIVMRTADNAGVLEAEEAVFLGKGNQVYESLTLQPGAMPTTDALISKVLETQETLYATDPAVVDGSDTEGVAERVEIAIYNSNGLDLHYENTLSELAVFAMVSDGTETADDFQIKLGTLEHLNPADLTKKAVSGALRKLGGDVAPTGSYPVVFAPEAMSSLLSTFSSIFSSESVQKGLSQMANKEGTAVAAPCVTLIDDPFYPENPMPIHFDGEGSPTHKKNVIENGVLNTLLYNLKTANQAGKTTTGNASKGSYNATVGIRPFTMYLAPGTYTEEALLAKAGNGVLIHALDGLHAGANPISGDFSLQSSGFLIEDGKATTAVKSFTVAGNFYQLLKNISALSDRVVLPFATGKTAFGSPLVLVEGLSIAGK